MADLAVDGEGGLWVATRFGILHRTGERWEVFDRRQGLPTEHFVSAAVHGGDLWFGTFDRGVLRLSAGKWIHYTLMNGLPDERIIDLLVDGNGSPWVVTRNGGLASFTGDAWEQVVLPQLREIPSGADGGDDDSTRVLDPAIRYLATTGGGPLDGKPFPPICIGLDDTGRCIVAKGNGIYQHTESGWRVIDVPDACIGCEPTSVMVARNGSLWLGTSERGAFVRDRRGWLRIGAVHGLTDERIISITEDAVGNIWIGTRRGGLNRFAPETAH
jgi:ligand-binding sensor domain-containing protein